MIDLGQKTYTRKTTGKTVWSLRETDRFGIISGVNEKVVGFRALKQKL